MNSSNSSALLSAFYGALWSAVFVTSLGGCAEKKDSSVAPPPQEWQIPAPTDEKETRELMKSAAVDCETSAEKDCPSAIGLLVLKNVEGGKTMLRQCTSFLVDDKTLVTNSHCIPEDLREAGKSCQGRIVVSFPKNENVPAEQAECETVLKTARITEKEGSKAFAQRPDFAVLRLSRALSRKPLRLSREGLPDLQTLKAFVIDPQSDTKPFGLLHEKTCSVVQGSTLAPGFIHPFHPVASLSDCEIIQGNSGSPILDSNGGVRAIVHAAWQPDESSSAATTPASAQVPLSLATNAACLDLPSEISAAAMNADCSRPGGDAKDLLRAKYASVDPAPVTKLFEQWKADLVPALKFELKKVVSEKSEIGEFALTPEVVCVNDPTRVPWTERVKMTADRYVTLNIRVPVWTYKHFLDGRLRYVLKPSIMAHMNVQIVFDVKQLLANGTTIGSSAVATEGSSKSGTTNENYQIKLCAPPSRN